MKLIWTQRAVDDLTALRAFIGRDYPVAARDVALSLVNSVDALAAHPNRGRPGRVKTTRELVVPRIPFIIVYRTTGDAIQILRIVHSAMNWPGTHH